MPDYENLRPFLMDFGWPGLIYVTVVWMAYKVWIFYTTTGREDRLRKLEADHLYRMAHTEKIDTLINTSHLTGEILARHTKSIDRMNDSFIRAGIHSTKET